MLLMLAALLGIGVLSVMAYFMYVFMQNMASVAIVQTPLPVVISSSVPLMTLDPASAQHLDPQAQCVAGGGTLIEFPNGGEFCHDECDKPASYACTRMMSFGCECGPTMCWDGEQCIIEQ